MKHNAFLLPRLARATFVLLGVLPWLVPALRYSAPFSQVGALVDLLFLPMCHRMAERTLVFGGIAMPLCSRCVGIFTGVAAGALFLWPSQSLTRWRAALAITGALMVADIVAQDLHLHPIWHPTRLLSGALIGYAIGSATIGALYQNAREDAAYEGP